MIYIVCARTFDDARHWACENDVPMSQVRVATSVGSVRGYTDFEVVYLPGFFKRPGAYEIADVVRYMVARRDAVCRAVAQHVDGG